jgi:hypothetical protein
MEYRHLTRTEASFDTESSLDPEVSGPKGRTKCGTRCVACRTQTQDKPCYSSRSSMAKPRPRMLGYEAYGSHLRT